MTVVSTVLHKLRYNKLKKELTKQTEPQPEEEQKKHFLTATEGLHRAILQLEEHVMKKREKKSRDRHSLSVMTDPYAPVTFFTGQNRLDWGLSGARAARLSILQQQEPSSACSRFVSGVSEGTPSPGGFASTPATPKDGNSPTPKMVRPALPRQSNTRGLLRVPAGRR